MPERIDSLPSPEGGVAPGLSDAQVTVDLEMPGFEEWPLSAQCPSALPPWQSSRTRCSWAKRDEHWIGSQKPGSEPPVSQVLVGV